MQAAPEEVGACGNEAAARSDVRRQSGLPAPDSNAAKRHLASTMISSTESAALNFNVSVELVTTKVQPFDAA